MADTSDPGEADLVRRAQVGDPQALRSLFDRGRAELRARVAARLPALARGRVSASDVVQEAYIVAFRRLGDFQGEANDEFGRWLYRIVDFKIREEIRRWMRTAKRAPLREVRLTSGTGGVDVPSPIHSPGTAAGAREERLEVLRALGRLDSEDRAILDLVHRGGLSFVEAGERLAISAEAARKRHGRALGRLSGLVQARLAP